MMWKFVQSHIILSYFGPTSTQYGPTPSERLLVVEAVKLVVEEDRTPDFFELQLCKTNRVGTSENIKTKTGKFIFQLIDFQVRTCSLFPKKLQCLSNFGFQPPEFVPKQHRIHEPECRNGTWKVQHSYSSYSTLSYSSYSQLRVLMLLELLYSQLLYWHVSKVLRLPRKTQEKPPSFRVWRAKKNIWRETSSSFDTLKLKVDDFFES